MASSLPLSSVETLHFQTYNSVRTHRCDDGGCSPKHKFASTPVFEQEHLDANEVGVNPNIGSQ